MFNFKLIKWITSAVDFSLNHQTLAPWKLGNSLIVKAIEVFVDNEDADYSYGNHGNRSNDSQYQKRFIYVRNFSGCVCNGWRIGFVCCWIRSLGGRWKVYSCGRDKRSGCWLRRVNRCRLGVTWSGSLSFFCWCVRLQGRCLLFRCCWFGIISGGWCSLWCSCWAYWWTSPVPKLPWPAPIDPFEVFRRLKRTFNLRLLQHLKWD